MKLSRSIRTAALFVGSVVGAGFATGQEVLLFFGADGVFSLLAASLFMAICAFAFMQIGAGRALSPRVMVATDTLVSLSSFAVYAAMIAAAEEVLFSLTGQRGLSALLAVAVSALSAKNAACLSYLNLLAVPFMIGVIILVGARSGEKILGGFHPLTSFAYGGMNLLFSGALMAKEGEHSCRAERVAASLLAGVLVFLMLLFMRRCVGAGTDMPFLSAADKAGMGKCARLALLLAVVTTMASCAYLGIDRVRALTGDSILAVGLVTLLGILLSRFGFAPIVRVAYPIVSYLGLAATLFALGYSLYASFARGALSAFWQKIPFKKSARGIDSGEKN